MKRGRTLVLHSGTACSSSSLANFIVLLSCPGLDYHSQISIVQAANQNITKHILFRPHDVHMGASRDPATGVCWPRQESAHGTWGRLHVARLCRPGASRGWPGRAVLDLGFRMVLLSSVSPVAKTQVRSIVLYVLQSAPNAIDQYNGSSSFPCVSKDVSHRQTARKLPIPVMQVNHSQIPSPPFSILLLSA